MARSPRSECISHLIVHHVREKFISDSHLRQPIRGAKGATDPGPRNALLDNQNPDILTPPETDNGSLPNLKFSFGMAHNRLEDGGWAREVTVRELPVAKSMAGVNMRLDSGVVRELHWHKEAEWAYILQGNVRLTVVDEDRNVAV
ncbi:cupin domain-containing protein [Bradyrhizobium sp. Leo170]|uniref:cupin domain-containing protein n=1 Tax=Bradyrhizobium sp. Leo170 TaxID=1571199 RepID=UPI0024BF54F8|nr:cupin domain-containing protein [Bradyrhizobium sp. Leo170]